MLKQLLLQVILILVNAFFAATEIAVISLNEKKIRAQAEDGDKKSIKMLKIIEQPTKFLSTIQIGITLAGFLGSAFAADNFAAALTEKMVRAFHINPDYAGAINTVAVILITLILSYFTLVLGELVPKRVAMKYKEKLAGAVCGVITFLATVLKPVIWFISASTNLVLRLFRVGPDDKDDAVSPEDIVIMLDAGADDGTLKHDDITYIKNVFKLEHLTAADIMTQRSSMIAVDSTATKEEIYAVIEEEGYSRIPVYDDNIDKIVGILHTRQYLLQNAHPDFKLEDAMLPPEFVPETIHLDLLFRDMQNSHTQMVIVVNEYGHTLGIVTMEDIIEELVGEIWDEQDEATENIVSVGEGVYRVQAGVSIDEFFDFFSLDRDDAIESSTVNGWLSEHFGNIPEVGASFVYETLSISVTKADELMAQEISVTVIPKVEEEEKSDEDTSPDEEEKGKEKEKDKESDK